MSTWRHLASLSWTFKWTLALDFLGTVVVIVGLEQGFALTLREVFNTLTGDALTSLSVWTLCAVLVGVSGCPLRGVRGHICAAVRQRVYDRSPFAEERTRTSYEHEWRPQPSGIVWRGRDQVPR